MTDDDSANRPHEYQLCEAGSLLGSQQGQLQQAVAQQNVWNNYANQIYGISDTGDETSPSEVNPVAIEEIYPHVETKEEKEIRMWEALRAAAQG